MLVTSTEIQMRFADIDILGHVNNVNLQHYFDLGKSDFFHTAFGLEVAQRKFTLIIVSTNNSYMEQTRMGDKIHVETSLESIGNKSITIFQRIVGSTDSVVRAESRTTLVAFDLVSQRSIAVPESWRKVLEL